MVLSALFDSTLNFFPPVQVILTWVLLYSGHYIKAGELCSSVSFLKSNQIQSCLDAAKEEKDSAKEAPSVTVKY